MPKESGASAGRPLGGLEVQLLPQLAQQRLRRAALPIAQEPVVGEDLHLIVREHDGQERVVLAGLAHPLRVHPRRRRRAVVAIGDVEHRHLPEERLEPASHLGRHHPQPVLDAVRRDEVVLRRGPLHRLDLAIDALACEVREEHRLVVRRERLDVAGAVVLLVRARLLVLLDDVADVLLHRGAGDEAGLPVGPHLLRVHVEARRRLPPQHPPARELVEVPLRLLVHLGRVLVRPLRKIDLRARDAEEAVGVPFRHRPRLGGVDDVVGRGGHPDGVVGGGAQRSEGAEDGHRGSSAVSPVSYHRRAPRAAVPSAPEAVLTFQRADAPTRVPEGEYMTRMMKGLALGLALALAAPAIADDAQDTVTEKKSDARRKVRGAKSDITGKKTADDRVEDAKDAAHGSAAKARKGARKTGRKVKHEAHEATK